MGSLISPTHLLFIAAIALIFLGPKKLPDLARSLGSGMREFRDSIGGDGAHDSVHDDLVHEDPVATLPAADGHSPAVEPIGAGSEHEALHAVPEPAPAFPSQAPSQATPLRAAERPDPSPPSAA